MTHSTRKMRIKPKEHVLKCWPEFFYQVKIGEKTADLRKDDRDFQKGDTILFQEYDAQKKWYSGHAGRVLITGVLRNFEGLKDGYCVLSIKVPVNAFTYTPPHD